MTEAALADANAQLDEAREEIRQLKTLLAGDLINEARLRDVFGLTPQQGKILHALIRRQYVSYDLLETIAGEVWRRGDRNLPSKHFAVQTSKLRKKIRPYGVEISNLQGFGYSMSVEDRAKIVELVGYADAQTPTKGE